MRSARMVPLVVVTALLTGCDTAPTPTEPPLLAPAAGNGGKLVFEFDFSFPVDCGGGNQLDLHVGGWVQVHLFQGNGNQNVELDVYHIVLTYANAAGETYVTRDVGPDHFYFDENGDLIINVTGRSLTGSGYIGHVVINLTTGETLFVAGKESGDIDAAACDALT